MRARGGTYKFCSEPNRTSCTLACRDAENIQRAASRRAPHNAFCDRLASSPASMMDEGMLRTDDPEVRLSAERRPSSRQHPPTTFDAPAVYQLV